MGQVVSTGCLGHGDHKGVEFQIAGGRRKKIQQNLGCGESGSFPGNSEVPWESVFEGTGVHGCQVVFKSNLKSIEAGNSRVLDIKQAWQSRDLVELRWTKKSIDFGNRDRWHPYRNAVCHCRERIQERVLTKLDHSFSWTAPQKGLFKNVNSNRRTRNYIGLFLDEAVTSQTGTRSGDIQSCHYL